MDQLARLAEIGFKDVGLWKLTDRGIAFDLVDAASAENVLYAFAVEKDLVYLGKTVKTLRNRMQGYKTPATRSAKGGTTNRNNHKRILDCLAKGKTVRILVLRDNGLLQYGGFSINLAAGLEDDLIRTLSPLWNGGKKETTTESLAPPEDRSSAPPISL